jgi:hypothetical protein
MKKLILLIFASVFSGVSVWAQANHWTLFPNYQMDASSGLISTFPSGSNIATCTPGSNRPGVLSNTVQGSYFAFNSCGFFDNTGMNITFPASGNMQMFEIPKDCEKFYTVGWEAKKFGGTYENRFVITTYTTQGGFQKVSSTAAVTYYSGDNANLHYAVSSLFPGGWRRIFVTYDDHMEVMEIAPNGGVWGTWSGPLLQSTVNPYPGRLLAEPDPRMNMEVSPNGQYLIYVSYGNSTSDVYIYDYVNNFDTKVGSFNIVSGIEYVPESILPAGSNPRLYVSHHNWTSSGGGIEYYETGTGWTNVTTSSDYGFSELELAKNGRLYLASNPDANNPSNGYYYCPNPGELVVLDPANGSMGPVLYNGNPVPVQTRHSNWGYIIQNQIDGENYSRPCQTEGCNSDFYASIDTRYPYTVDFGAYGDGPYEWNPTPGVKTIGNYNYSYTYPSVSGASYRAKLKIIHPWDYCVSALSFCLSGVTKSSGDAGIEPGDPACSVSSDFVMGLSITNPMDITLQPTSGSEPYYYITWGDGSDYYSSAPLGFIHTYTAAGSYKVCMQTGNGTDCKTCMDVCVPDPNGAAADDDHDRIANNDGAPKLTMQGTGETAKLNQNSKGAPDNRTTKISGNKHVVLKAYPNPTSGTFTIGLKMDAPVTLHLTLYDIQGREVLIRDEPVKAGNAKIQLDISSFNNGLYLLKVSDDKGTTYPAIKVKKE